MSLGNTNSSGAQGSGPSSSGNAPQKNVDLQKLAERVLRLLKKEMRIEKERQGARRRK